MSGQKQRTTFAKQQRERARMEKAAEKRKRREERKLGEGFGPDDGHVIIRVDRERDVTGRQVVSLLVGDSAASTLTLEAIEGRESGRGLAIVRDLVRQWRGHLVVRAEAPPFTKGVGACFPL